MAFTVPNTAANAGKTASIASKVMIAIDRFDILLPLGNRKSGSVSLSLIDNRLAAAWQRSRKIGHSFAAKLLRRRWKIKCANQQPDEWPAVLPCLELGFKRGEGRDQCEKKNRQW
jgi:hypothetical protein